MAKKKKPEEPVVLPAAEPQSRSSDRHKPRKTVALPPRYYRQLVALATANRRPLQWELLLAVEAHLRAAGLWPPPEDAD